MHSPQCFSFYLLMMCIGPNFPLHWLVINPIPCFLPRQIWTPAALAVWVQLLFACCFLCCCVRVPQARSRARSPACIACVSVENCNVLGSGTFTNRCVFPTWLGVIKDHRVSFCPKPSILAPPLSVKSIAVFYPKDTENKCNTCGLRASLSKAWKLPEGCL